MRCERLVVLAALVLAGCMTGGGACLRESDCAAGYTCATSGRCTPRADAAREPDASTLDGDAPDARVDAPIDATAAVDATPLPDAP
jgi:hypothetical protein